MSLRRRKTETAVPTPIGTVTLRSDTRWSRHGPLEWETADVFRVWPHMIVTLALALVLRATTAPAAGIAVGALGLLIAGASVDLVNGDAGRRWGARGVAAMWVGAFVHWRTALPTTALLPVLAALTAFVGWRRTMALLMPTRTQQVHDRRELAAARQVTPKRLASMGLHKDTKLVNTQRHDHGFTDIYLLPPVPGATPNLETLQTAAAVLHTVPRSQVHVSIPGAANLLHVEVADRKDFEGTAPAFPARDTWPAEHQPLGWDRRLNVRYLDLSHRSGKNVLIAGTNGSGKTTSARTLVYGRLALGHHVVIIDWVKRVDYAGLTGYVDRLATTKDEAAAALRAALRTMEARANRMHALGQTYWLGRPYTLVMDEAAIALREPEAEAAMLRLASEGRSRGMLVIIITQHPSVDLFTGPLKANMNLSLVHRTRSTTDSNVALGAGAKGRGLDASTLRKPGRCIAVLDNEEFELQMFATPPLRALPFRSGADPQLRAHRDTRRNAHGADVAQYGKHAPRLLAELRKAGAPMGATDLAALVGCSGGRAHETLTKMGAGGLIERAGPGHRLWQVPGPRNDATHPGATLSAT